MLAFCILSFAHAETPLEEAPPATSPEEAPQVETAPPTDPNVAPPLDANSAPNTDVSTMEERPVPTEGELEKRYLEAYAYWQQGRWSRASELATEILEDAPDYRPAMLLRGYALTKGSDPSAGVALLEALASFPAENPMDRAIQARAKLLAARFTDRQRRDQIAIMAGEEIVIERNYEGVALRSGIQLQVQIPIRDVLGVRVEYGGAWDAGFGTSLSVSGPHLATMAVAELPMKDARSYLDLGVGPALWVAEGLFWKSNLHVYGGLRTAIGADWRFARRTGLRVEGGWSWWPAMQEDLPFLSQPLDIRASLVIWMGK